MLDIAHAVVERSLVNHGIHECTEVAHIAHLDFVEHLADSLLHLGPQALGHIGARSGRAFLTLELEGAANNGCGHLLGIGRLVHEDKVLAACLAHNLGIGLIVGDVVAD